MFYASKFQQEQTMTDMENRQSESSCEICEGPVFTTCVGCGEAVCQACARFELIGSGCGSVWAVYYCQACAMDPDMNPNAILREPEELEAAEKRLERFGFSAS